MASVTWTEEQKQVIEARGCNLLVSAAAGSGKTAVLVERIIRMVTDLECPVDIDRLLVMTFTNAAASEMRERIGAALEKRLEENPGDRNLERQTTLIHHARITTIDSFCLGLLREHFQELDIDPGFRIGEEGELLLLQADVMRDLLEEYYGREEPRFLHFVDAYASGKADGGLEDYILRVWQFAQSNPWPGEWIARCKKELSMEAGNLEETGETAWMRFLLGDVRLQAEEFLEDLREAAELSAMEDGPAAYAPMLSEDIRAMEGLLEAKTYREVYDRLSGPLFGRLAAVRAKNVDPEKKERAAALRNRAKDGMKKMKALYAPGTFSEIFEDMAACREPVLMLLELAEEFSARFQEAKEEKNLVDFNDLEHFALEVLTGGSRDHSPGPVADELAGFFAEILVDEYQDSNQVQETLIQCISGERFGRPNVFMVGDVKQSIYKFRLAKPELFLEKYERYGTDGGTSRKIELHKNFRSRDQVLSSINDVFYRIMTRALGNISYTKEAALYPGAAYPEPETENQCRTELLLLNTGEEFFSSMDEEKADYTAKEAEARLIAAKIKELTDPERGMKIWNGKTGQLEPLKKKDIVILLRSLSGWAEEFLSVLEAAGIPAYADSRTGYFTAVEVETVLNMLALIDNPMQDIPLAGVLRSPMAGLSDRELALIMAAWKKNPEKGEDGGFYGAVENYLRMGEEDGAAPDRGNPGRDWPEDVPTVWADGSKENCAPGRDGAAPDPIREKLLRFFEMLTLLRRESLYLPVHRLLYRIFELTGYYDYVSAMPAGRVRQANLNMLVEKASAYEKTSYQSLFDFIRYIEKLKKFNTDFGEASRSGENDDAVRIMSIHKSKGLEFPVVILAGAGKQFNRQDTRGKILIDEELGVATDFFDTEKKVKAPTLKKNVLSRRSGLESMGEELRILYVAMTRAKEKLLITAADKYLDNKLDKWGGRTEENRGNGGLPFTALSAANSYLDWLLMAAEGARASLCVRTVPVEELLTEETKNQEEKAETALYLGMLRNGEGTPGLGAVSAGGHEPGQGGTFRAEAAPGPDAFPWMQKPYPFEADLTLHAKMSVSELKERGQFVDDGESDFLPTIPEFLETEKEDGGSFPGRKKPSSGVDAAFRGTAYHRALELMSFPDAESVQGVERELLRLGEQKLMDEKALQLLDAGLLAEFFRSPIAARMVRAEKDGLLHRESQFVMGIPAREMDEADSDEPVLIQGIIDAWFEEEDGIVLVDYKTDWLKEGGEPLLLERYRLQMIYYAKALTQITGKPVKEAVLYSLSLRRQVEVPIPRL